MSYDDRDIDQIVTTHELAEQRRKAGKPIWSKKINIKEIIHRDQDNNSPDHVVSVAKEIAALIRAKVPAEWLAFSAGSFDETLYEIVEFLEGLSINDDDPCEEFNYCLRDLYDWADANRVWLG